MELELIDLMKSLVCLFFTILFLQSGLDKVFDWRGNRDFIVSHFSKTPLGFASVPMLWVMTGLETLAGVLCGLGLVLGLLQGAWIMATYGLLLSAVSFIALFFGQRIAKDYEGAATLAIYFGVVLISLQLFLDF